jgi:transcriptional regulator with XRE-family HTH domain
MTPNELKQLRLALGWSQARLAQELGFSAYTISKWERGVPGYPIPTLVEKYLDLLLG